MNNKALWSVAVGSLIFSGCGLGPPVSALAAPPPSAGVCKQKQCMVTVRVAACSITLDPDWLGVAKGNRDVEIIWEIRGSPGVVFAKGDAIFLKDPAVVGKHFREPKAPGDTKYRWLHANSGPGIYYYGVRVVDNGKACPPYDPVIIDEM